MHGQVQERAHGGGCEPANRGYELILQYQQLRKDYSVLPRNEHYSSEGTLQTFEATSYAASKLILYFI